MPSERGEATIRVLGLYRQDLRDHRDRHMRHRRACGPHQNVLASGDAAAVVVGDVTCLIRAPFQPRVAMSSATIPCR